MIEALRSGHLVGAFLDVFETEPLPAESPLWALENVVIPEMTHKLRDMSARLEELDQEDVVRVHMRAPSRLRS